MTDKSDTCENRKFIKHLKKASKIVASWPLWKRNVLVFWNHTEEKNDRSRATY